MLSPADQKFLFKRRKSHKFLPPVVPYTLTGIAIVLALYFFSEFTKLESYGKLKNKEYLEKIESIEVHSESEKNLHGRLVREIKAIDSLLLFLIPRVKYLLVIFFLIIGFLSLEYYRNDRRLLQIINKLEGNKSL